MYLIGYTRMSAGLFTPFTAADLCGVDYHRVADAVREGTLRAYRVGGAPVILGDDLVEWVQSHPAWV